MRLLILGSVSAHANAQLASSGRLFAACCLNQCAVEEAFRSCKQRHQEVGQGIGQDLSFDCSGSPESLPRNPERSILPIYTQQSLDFFDDLWDLHFYLRIAYRIHKSTALKAVEK